MHYLGCLAYKCGERLPTNWAPLLLYPRQDLLSRLQDRRIRHPVDCNANMRWCRRAECNKLVHILDSVESTAVDSASILFNESMGSDSSARGGNGGSNGGGVTDNSSSVPIAHSTLCYGCGHSFCLNCEEEGHAPCSCEQWTKWRKIVSDELQAVGDVRAGTWLGYFLLNVSIFHSHFSV